MARGLRQVRGSMRRSRSARGCRWRPGDPPMQGRHAPRAATPGTCPGRGRGSGPRVCRRCAFPPWRRRSQGRARWPASPERMSCPPGSVWPGVSREGRRGQTSRLPPAPARTSPQPCDTHACTRGAFSSVIAAGVGSKCASWVNWP